MQAAQGAFQAGSASFNEADYPRAIFYWEDAYRRDCTAHAMLKNLARAYELNEQYRHAIHALTTYMERKPDSGEDEAIQRRIENLERKLEERNAAVVAPPQDKPAQTEPRKQGPPPPVTEPTDEFPDYAEEDPPSGRSVLPLVFAGAGAAAGVLGGVQWAIARQDATDVENACGPGGRENCRPPEVVGEDSAETARRLEDLLRDGNDANSRQQLWGIVGGAGAAVAVVGLIWYFAQSDGTDDAAEDVEEENSLARISPSLGFGFAGVNVRGTF
jgi:tetratricopeptide (TPR) repeat protein